MTENAGFYPEVNFQTEGKMRKRMPVIIALFLAFCVFAAGCGNGEEKVQTPVNPNPGGAAETFDATKLPYYVEDTTTLQYSYTDEERIRPYWQGNVMYNEQLMIVEKDGVTQGRLLYKPTRVISVRDWKLDVEYVEGKDYNINGDTITLPEGSKIPVFRDEWSRGINIPSEYPAGNAAGGYQMIGSDGTVMYTEAGLTWKNYIHVTYAYDPADVDRTVVAKYDGALYGLSERMADPDANKNIKMVVFGDSISEGCSSSQKWGHEPLCPPYADLVKGGLEKFGGLNVTLNNISVGGKDSTWAAKDEQLNKISALVPDLLIIAFGTNDPGANIELNGKDKSTYRKNIERVIETAKTVNSECQILLVAPFPSHEKSQSPEAHRMIAETLKTITEETPYMDVGYVNNYDPCLKMLEKKNYYEIAANNVNHPNDFVHRFYAMNILSTVIDFGSLAK